LHNVPVITATQCLICDMIAQGNRRGAGETGYLPNSHNMNATETNKEYARFSWQIAFVIAAEISALLLGLIRLPILTKNLGADLYGTWALLDVTISLITPFALIGLHMGIVRFLSAEKDKARIREDFFSLFSIVLAAGTALAVLLIVFSDLLAVHIFKDAGLSVYIKMASVLILLNAIIILSLAYFQAFRQIGLRTGIGLIQGILQIGLLAVFVTMGYKLAGVIAAFAASGVFVSLVMLFIIIRQSGFRLPRFSRLREYLAFSLPLTPNVAIAWIINASDRYVISYFMGTADTGIYNAAYSIGSYAAFVMMPIGIVLYPTISKLYDEGKLDETRTYLSYSVKYFTMVAIPAAFGVSILAKPLLQVLTTAEFVPGAVIVPYVAAGIIIASLHPIGEYIILLAKKTKLLVLLLGGSAILNVVLNIILIPQIELLGAAIATLITYTFLGVSAILISRRYVKFNLNPLFIIKSLAASAVMALCIWLISPVSVIWVIASIAIGAIIYFSVLIVLRGLSRGEIRFFIKLVTGSLNKLRGRA